MMLIVPLTGCTGSEETDYAEDLEKFEIDSVHRWAIIVIFILAILIFLHTKIIKNTL